jgi:endonuclease/exonuclease/phosphatase family metal-dependent hydrolase
MRLMTYNIRLGIQQGLEPLAQHITAQQADVVALQEVGDRWVMGPSGDTTRDLSRMTALPHALHAAAILRTHKDSDQLARYGHALLSRWPLLNPTVHLLPIVKDEQRTILSVTLDAPSGPLLLLTTHLSWLIQDRPTHGQHLLNLARHEISRGRRVVIMGDLNEDDPQAPWLQSLRAITLDADLDAARLTFPSKAPRVRLDFLFTNAGSWRDVTVTPDPLASDHLPLAATLVVSG